MDKLLRMWIPRHLSEGFKREWPLNRRSPYNMNTTRRSVLTEDLNVCVYIHLYRINSRIEPAMVHTNYEIRKMSVHFI
jgi:hypothetical protein